MPNKIAKLHPEWFVRLLRLLTALVLMVPCAIAVGMGILDGWHAMDEFQGYGLLFFQAVLFVILVFLEVVILVVTIALAFGVSYMFVDPTYLIRNREDGG